MARKDIKTVSTNAISIEHGGQGGQVSPTPKKKLNQKQKFYQSPDFQPVSCSNDFLLF